MTTQLKNGIYNVEYYTGSQASIYIGDVWVDEITAIGYEVSQNKVPLYGYNDQLYRDVSKGQVLVQGSFTINFKEAGYLFLILERYQRIMKGQSTPLQPFLASDLISRSNIEDIINNQGLTLAEKNNLKLALVEAYVQQDKGTTGAEAYANTLKQGFLDLTSVSAKARLLGYSSDPRLGKKTAESSFEVFEDEIWKNEKSQDQSIDARRADANILNPFDIYVAYGDFAGDNSVNHTIRRIVGVHVLSTSQQIQLDGLPISETYQFLAQNII